MKKRHLKKWVIPSGILCLLLIIGVFLTILSTNISGEPDTVYRFVNTGFKTRVLPVFNEETLAILKPVNEGDITITNEYYSKDNTIESQEKSIIYYDDTYMPSTGYTYTSENSFEVMSVLDGVVEKITKDELLGNIITINHGNGIVTVYYSLDNIKVQENDEITSGTIIATSAPNKIYGALNTLLFEVNIDGNLIDPANFFNMDINSVLE